MCRRAESPLLSAGFESVRLVKPLRVATIHGICCQDAGTICQALETLLVEAERIKLHGVHERELRICEEDRKSSLESTWLERHALDSDDLVEDCVSAYTEGETIMGVGYECRWMLAILPIVANVQKVNQKVKELLDFDHNVLYHVTQVDSKSREGSDRPLTREMLKETINKVKDMASKGEIAPWEEEEIPAQLWSPSLPEEINQMEEACVESQQKLDSVGADYVKFKSGVQFVLKQTDFEKDAIYMKGFALRGTAQYSKSSDDFLNASAACSVALGSGCKSQQHSPAYPCNLFFDLWTLLNRAVFKQHAKYIGMVVTTRIKSMKY